MIVSLPLQILTCYLLIVPAAYVTGLSPLLWLPIALVTGPVLLGLSYWRFVRAVAAGDDCCGDEDDASVGEEAAP